MDNKEKYEQDYYEEQEKKRLQREKYNKDYYDQKEKERQKKEGYDER